MKFDAVVIPGGGLLPGGVLPPWVANRLDRAAELIADTEFIITLSAATIYKPAQVDARGKVIFESVVAVKELKRRGVAPERLLVETASYDTIGNAYFCRTIHTEPRGLRRLLILTSEFHAPRTERTFRWIFGAAPDPGYELTFEATPDVGMSASLLEGRRRKEREGAESAAEKAMRYRTLAEVHRFLYTEHGIYAAAKWDTEPYSLEPEVLESY